MNTVTAIKPQKGRKGRVNVFLEGHFAFSLSLSLVEEAGLRVGEELDEQRIAQLLGKDRFERVMEASIRYLGYRPLSELELRLRLRRRNFDENTIREVIHRLKEQGHLDDATFAQFWRDNRDAFSPRGRRLLRRELKLKGVAPEIAEEITQGVDDEASAYKAAQKKAKALAKEDYSSFRNKLHSFLRSRGFDYLVARGVIERLWRQRAETE